MQVRCFWRKLMQLWMQLCCCPRLPSRGAERGWGGSSGWLPPPQYSIDIIMCETMIDPKIGSKWSTSPLPKFKRDDGDYPRERERLFSSQFKRTPYLFFETWLHRCADVKGHSAWKLVMFPSRKSRYSRIQRWSGLSGWRAIAPAAVLLLQQQRQLWTCWCKPDCRKPSRCSWGQSGPFVPHRLITQPSQIQSRLRQRLTHVSLVARMAAAQEIIGGQFLIRLKYIKRRDPKYWFGS